MSRAVSVLVLLQLRRRLKDGYLPIPPRDMPEWVKSWHKGLEKVNYFKPGEIVLNHNPDSIVRLRGEVQVKRHLAGFAKPDIEKVWDETVSKGLQAYHALEDRDGGFDFHFAAVDAANQYISGTLTVVPAEWS